MASPASHPLIFTRQPVSASSRALLLRSLPDPHDRRYPRARWLRLLRGSSRIWWVPLVVYLAHAASALVAWDTHDGLSAMLNGSRLTRALLVTPLQPWLDGQSFSTLALFASLAFAVVTMAVLCCVQLARWSARDSVREAEILLLRNVRSAEWSDGAWMWRAFAPALEWRLKAMRRNGFLLRVGLLLVALAAGVLLGLAIP
jgi:hypothetical protein